MENKVKSEVNQLPEADALPDGFVESSSPEHLEEEANDYKEEKLLQLDSRSDVVITDGGGTSFGEVDENVGDQIDKVIVVADPLEAEAARGEENHDKEKSFDKDMDFQAVRLEDVSLTGSAENNKKEVSEVKRKNVKRSFKTEKEFLEFTLKYQQVIVERDSAIAVRDKLESLCRELQRQNKMLMVEYVRFKDLGSLINLEVLCATYHFVSVSKAPLQLLDFHVSASNMDECKRVSSDGQNLRIDLSNKFQDAIKEVSNKLEEQKDECLSQLKENEMLKTKLKQLVDQYALSEQQHAQKLKQKTLELQLADLKHRQQEEKLKQEQSQMKPYAEQVAQLLATEKNLRLQLTADGEKFQQFQEALLKSHEVFETFKQEIEKMAKSIKELKKENTFLKSKCEKSDVTLIELADERERLKKQLEKTRNQKEKLESLCRSLQAERRANAVGSNSLDSIPD